MTGHFLKRLKMGLMTLTGLGRRGFFSPYRYASGIPDHVAPYAEISAMMRNAEPAMNRVLASIQSFAPEMTAIGGKAPEPRWQQDWFTGLDAAAAYAILRDMQPKRIVEVGSGHSTRFMARAIRDGGFPCKFTAIDPFPRADLGGLAVHWEKSLLSASDFGPFDALESGDIAFIDSSHLLWPGTDVDIFFARLLPRLMQGVIVHIHDVFLPDGYPEEWHWRGYTEQQGVAALLAGGGYDILFSAHFCRTCLDVAGAAPVLKTLPVPELIYETSLWLRKGSAKTWRP